MNHAKFSLKFNHFCTNFYPRPDSKWKIPTQGDPQKPLTTAEARAWIMRLFKLHKGSPELGEEEIRMLKVAPRVHSYRRTLASWGAAAGVHLKDLNMIYGHANQSTTQIYIDKDCGHHDRIKDAICANVKRAQSTGGNFREILWDMGFLTVGKDGKPLDEDARPIVVGEVWRRLDVCIVAWF